MGTTADKLARVARTKAEIAGVLRDRGIDVEGLPFSRYPGLIESLGGAGPADPETLYRLLRPEDWMALPEPGEDELYMLMFLSP